MAVCGVWRASSPVVATVSQPRRGVGWRGKHSTRYHVFRRRKIQLLLIGPQLYEALTTLLEPQVRVEVHGYYGPNFAGAVRMHAGVANHRATLALQLPGRTPEYGGDIILMHGIANSLPARIAASLPKCAPGGHPSIRGRRSDLQTAEYSRNPLYLSHTEQLNRIIRRPRSSVGEIAVHPGPATDSRPTDDGRSVHWMDYLPADGRYLLHHHRGNEFTLTPAQPEELTRTIHSLIAATQHTLTSPR
ncbi:ESX secretion-associated protein EspG [Nocardia sp. GAS34]|uniref:ESX secretion-associated protein EspG n=1 Tax=unclassified Nocardia TaxID=2637762 RepID=UPI003D1DF78B